jgi:2-polyprenyl-6-methoxyphenol hydroxylase-like FAD-dependent oxidoreductase
MQLACAARAPPRRRTRIAPAPRCAATAAAPRAPPALLGDTALVIGASFAGLLSAAALAPHFRRVLVLDRDAALPGAGAAAGAPAAPRRGVPQSAQPHVLFARGAAELQRVCPGLGAELDAAGALRVDWAAEFRCFVGDAWAANTAPDAGALVASWTCSRYLLETAVRRRVAALPNVTWHEGARVTGLLRADADESGGQQPGSDASPVIAGVLLSDGTALRGALTVNAAGRGSAAAAWLAAAGVAGGAPEVTRVDAGLRYATRIFARGAGAPPLPWKVLLVSHEAPARRRLGYLAQLEGGRLVATLGGYERDAPPLDAPGWLAFARSLPGGGAFVEALHGAQPEGGQAAHATAHAATANVRRVYPPLPGLVHVGDAALALCPAYGQGMTMAAIGAAALRDAAAAAAAQAAQAGGGADAAAAALAALPAALAAPLAAASGPAWALAAGQDALFPTATLLPPPGSPAAGARALPPPLAWYLRALRRAATAQPAAWRALLAVAHQVAGPESLFAPPLAARVLAAEAAAALERLRGGG